MSAPELSIHGVSRVVRHVEHVKSHAFNGGFDVTYLSIYAGDEIVMSLCLFAHDLKPLSITEPDGVALPAPSAGSDGDNSPCVVAPDSSGLHKDQAGRAGGNGDAQIAAAVGASLAEEPPCPTT